ncbi:MAG: NmrA family NAD(P)-binding protein [Bryobacteraceae bacterium]
MSKIVVIGGTGTVGSQTVQELLKRGADVRVMTRSADRIASLPKGVEGVVGSMLKPESLPAVFAGADKLFLITPLDRDETAQGIDAVDAAVAAGVRRIVFLSVHHADKALTIPHFVSKLPVEGVIRASGVEYTILRPNNFYQNDLAVLDAIRAGIYPMPLTSVGTSRVDVRDIAEAATITLTQSGHSGKTYSLVGPKAWTSPETVELLTRHLGKPVLYVGDDLKAWAAQMRAFMPGWLVRDLEIMFQYFMTEGLLATQAEVDELTAVLGHAPRSYEAFIKEVLPV